MTDLFAPTDVVDRRLALRAPDLLGEWNRAGVLEAADVHVATRLARLTGVIDPDAVLAAALVVRATRRGSVCLDLDDPLELPEEAAHLVLGDWWAGVKSSVEGSALVSSGVLHLDESRLYLDRYWREEGSVVADLATRAAAPKHGVDLGSLDAALGDLFPPGYEEQRDAARSCLLAGTSVLTGGPGTGKTATLARLLAVANRMAGRPLRIALAAPTGKAAARMTQAIGEELGKAGFTDADRAALADLDAMTLHRLLGSRPDNSTRFRRHRGDPLTHEVVVVDESSMISLTLMARLVEALRPETRLILVGDARQLSSVEAGAVLENVVDGLRGSAGSTAVSELTTTHRFEGRSGIDQLARAVNAGDASGAWDVLTGGLDDVVLVAPDDEATLRTLLLEPALTLADAAHDAEAQALAALAEHRLLCAHREGPFGVGHWNRQMEEWLMAARGRDWLPRWYEGQPLLVNVNDYSLRLWNGDTGVVVADRARPGQLQALFDDGTSAGRRVSLTRLPDTQTAHAMTVHRSQGSQFAEVTVILPEEASALLTRELVYTALTRARRRVRLVTTRAAFTAAVERRAVRATGLRERLDRALDRARDRAST